MPAGTAARGAARATTEALRDRCRASASQPATTGHPTMAATNTAADSATSVIRSPLATRPNNAAPTPRANAPASSPAVATTTQREPPGPTIDLRSVPGGAARWRPRGSPRRPWPPPPRPGPTDPPGVLAPGLAYIAIAAAVAR